ncbi:hypothetical protein HPB47_000825, partial [Ixodes persulcatus]
AVKQAWTTKNGVADRRSLLNHKLARVKALVLADRRITIEEIAQQVSLNLGISAQHSSQQPAYDEGFSALDLRKEAAAKMLQLCESDPDNFFDRLITMDECWVHH